MAYAVNGIEVINDEAAIVHESFPQIAGTIQSTEVKITASDGATEDYFGTDVAVGSGRIVVGANSDDDVESNSGSAYIFDLEGNQLAKITASDPVANKFFGQSVAVGSGRIVIGAHFDSVDFVYSGAAYIFDLDGNQLAKIKASDPAFNDNFGQSVAVGSGRIVVGSPLDDDNGSTSGSAYIFDLDGNQLSKITAGDGAAGDRFGYSVAVGCGRILVGAYGDADNGSFTGSAYIFDLDGNQLTKITANDGAAEDYFGLSVAVGSGKILIGARGNNLNGSAYIFDLDGNQLTKITASDGADNDRFGTSVAVGSGKIVVGSIFDDDNGADSGSIYIFDLDGNQLEKITASDGAAGDQFYKSAIGSGKIVVSARLDDDNDTDSGSAYIYSLSEDHNTYWERILDTYKY